MYCCVDDLLNNIPACDVRVMFSKCPCIKIDIVNSISLGIIVCPHLLDEINTKMPLNHWRVKHVLTMDNKFLLGTCVWCNLRDISSNFRFKSYMIPWLNIYTENKLTRKAIDSNHMNKSKRARDFREHVIVNSFLLWLIQSNRFKHM